MPDALETALRELREPASPEFAAELDARVRGGFGAPADRRSAPSFAPRRRRDGPGRLRKLLLPVSGLAATAALLFVVISIGSQLDTGGSDVSSSAGSGGASTASSSDEAASPSADSGASGSSRKAAPQLLGSNPDAAASPGKADRKVERSAALTLTTTPAKVETAATGISDVADRFGGYVESSSVNAGSDRGSGDFVLRLPVGRVDAAMAALARVGRVTDRRQSSEDITGTHDRARAALGEARAERTSLLRRLAAATTDEQTASLRARLRDANATIDRALTAVRQVDRRAAYARVDVTLVGREADGTVAPDGDDGSSWGPGAAWEDAQRVLAVAAGVAVVALAVILPLALLGLLGLGGRRIHVSRARRRVLDTV